MAKLKAEEVQKNLPKAISVGTQIEDGLLVQKVVKGHITDTYAETRIRPEDTGK